MSDDLHATLAARRRALGLTQQKVADRVGCTQSAISDMEHGRHDGRLSTVRRWARALDMRLVLEPAEDAS